MTNHTTGSEDNLGVILKNQESVVREDPKKQEAVVSQHRRKQDISQDEVVDIRLSTILLYKITYQV